jgi:hypothetical protein
MIREDTLLKGGNQNAANPVTASGVHGLVGGFRVELAPRFTLPATFSQSAVLGELQEAHQDCEPQSARHSCSL